jgi:hypothetical protein
MAHGEQIADEKFTLLKSLGMAILIGSVTGILDIWAFEPSLKMFLAGQAAGITFWLAFTLFGNFIDANKGPRLYSIITISGALGALAWWIVAGDVMQLWLVILLGITVPNLTFALEENLSRIVE